MGAARFLRLAPVLGVLALTALVGCGDDDIGETTTDAGDGDGAINRPDSGPGPTPTDGGADTGPGPVTPETFTQFARRLVLTETKDNNAPQAESTFTGLTDTPAAADFPAAFFP